MSRFHILGWITLACALGLTVLFLLPTDPPAVPTANVPAPSSKNVAQVRSPSLAPTQASPRPRSRAQAPQLSDLRVAAAEGASPEIASTARWIDATARKRLEEMTERYRLTPVQQADIYPVIARNLPGFSPEKMAIIGGGLRTVRGNESTAAQTPSATVQDELFDLLDPDQQALMADDSLDAALWWKEIAALLESDLNAAIAGSLSPGGPLDETPADQAAPDLNLFDLLGQ